MKRRYILCEQLDKHVDIILRRMKKVIAGEQSGISKRNNWHGGGSFVYCELAQLNDKYLEAITKAENDEQLKSVWLEIAKNGFISSYVSPQEIDPNADDFKSLSFDDKKDCSLHYLIRICFMSTTVISTTKPTIYQKRIRHSQTVFIRSRNYAVSF